MKRTTTSAANANTTNNTTAAKTKTTFFKNVKAFKYDIFGFKFGIRDNDDLIDFISDALLGEVQVPRVLHDAIQDFMLLTQAHGVEICTGSFNEFLTSKGLLQDNSDKDDEDFE